MRLYLSLLVSSVLFMSGCADRPELSPSAYGTILETLPELGEAAEPFPFPISEDGNDHKNCVFNEEEFF